MKEMETKKLWHQSSSKMSRITAVIVLAFMLLCASACQEKEGIVFQPENSFTEKTESVAEASANTEAGTGASEAESDAESVCYVHICGEVMRPGVYQVARGSRLYEVILLAGGLSGDACDSEINQASVVEDGMQIYIPAIGESTQAQEAESADSLVNINTADIAALCTLPGVGESRAQAIITYREEHGNFTTKEELMQVAGIKQGVYDKLKDYIKV